jgi:hypothetical protein
VVPSGYTANQSDCQDGDPLNGSCTIINTPNARDTDDVISSSSFETGQADGWSLQGGAKIDSSVAIGQYSLVLANDGAKAEYSLSTSGYSDVGVTMHLASSSLERSDFCYAEISTNGGATWSMVLKLADDSGGVFKQGTASPAAASDNPNLRLRFRMAGKGKGDYCWGDDVFVRGTVIGGAAAAAKASGAKAEATEVAETVIASIGSNRGLSFGSRGFDPGFDHLVGDGNVDRRELTYAMLQHGRGSARSAPASAFAVPGGASQPTHYFEGALELRSLTGSSLSNDLPGFSFEFVQVGNHLYPVGRAGAMPVDPILNYAVDTGRVWNEAGDRGFSRAAIPFTVTTPESACAQEGVVSFLFRSDGTTSKAAYRVFGAHCGANSNSASGMLEAVYSPATVGNQAPGIETVTTCAAETWLPQVQGRGGISMVLMPDDTTHFVLSDPVGTLWLDAMAESEAISSLCE